MFMRRLRFLQEKEFPMSRSLSNTQLWPANKNASRLLSKSRHIFYGHKFMEELRILARLARPATPSPKTPSRRATTRAR
jgi:hypothetical protein